MCKTATYANRLLYVHAMWVWPKKLAHFACHLSFSQAPKGVSKALPQLTIVHGPKGKIWPFLRQKRGKISETRKAMPTKIGLPILHAYIDSCTPTVFASHFFLPQFGTSLLSSFCCHKNWKKTTHQKPQ